MTEQTEKKPIQVFIDLIIYAPDDKTRSYQGIIEAYNHYSMKFIRLYTSPHEPTRQAALQHVKVNAPGPYYKIMNYQHFERELETA
jgi:hypothetical protein